MVSPIFLCYAVLGGCVQLAVIYLMRVQNLSFAYVLPAIVFHQYLFTTAYANAPNFVVQWFFTAAITGFASYLMGVFLFQDKINHVNIFGIAFIFIGLFLLKYKPN